MKYTINHTCGHNSVANLYGSSVERAKRVAWLSEQECPECKKARELAQAQGNAQRLGLPALQGSEKQIAWAMSIRDKMLADAPAGLRGQTIAQCVEKFYGFSEAQKAQLAAAKDTTLAMIYNVATQTSAAWFIDNRVF